MSSPERSNNKENGAAAPLDILRQFARKREARPPSEQCEMCSAEIPANHRHMLELSRNTLVCVCRPCSILFGDSGAGNGKYRLVPSRYLLLSDFSMTDEQWDDLMVPVNMVYVFNNSLQNRVTAFYPSPAGAIESTLNMDGWNTLLANNPVLQDLEPDVEALLINRVGNNATGTYREHYIVPIDTCFELVGLIRLKWRGLSGGEDAWKAIAEFFTNLRKRAMPVENPKPPQHVDSISERRG